jgi:hypothetical protein
LLNTIIGLSVLSKGGNFVMKIYDLYSHFTVSLLYILNNYFEKLTVIKPFSTRPHNATKYIIFQKLTEYKPKILDYLYEFYDKYITVLADGEDIEFVYPISKIIKDENFKSYLMDVNSQYTEQRIETLEELKKAIDKLTFSKYDKMDIKKKCLDFWKVPVLHYDPKQVINNQDQNNKKNNQNNKLADLKEKARYLEDYDKNSASMQQMMSLYEPRKVEEERRRRLELEKRERETVEAKRLEEEKETKFLNLLKNSKKGKASSTNKKKDEMESFINKKRQRDERDRELQTNGRKDTRIKINMDDEQDNISKKQKIIETSLKNRQIEGINN